MLLSKLGREREQEQMFTETPGGSFSPSQIDSWFLSFGTTLPEAQRGPGEELAVIYEGHQQPLQGMHHTCVLQARTTCLCGTKLVLKLPPWPPAPTLGITSGGSISLIKEQMRTGGHMVSHGSLCLVTLEKANTGASCKSPLDRQTVLRFKGALLLQSKAVSSYLNPRRRRAPRSITVRGLFA